jgi:DNA polymerase (family 10)
VEAAARRGLPIAPIETDLLGDLHVHTTLSGDGRSSIDDIVAHAAARGYSYLALTDHAENLPINGVSRAELRAPHDTMAVLQQRYPQMTLLRGCELNIGPRGDLDYDLDFRLSLDWCVAAVHSHFDMDATSQTDRILRAMEDPSVSVIGHLSGRMIGRRPGIELDIDAVLRAAVETGTAIELNSSLSRLDAASDVIRRARDLGVVFVISTDAHHIDDLTRMQWGVRHAARGWLERQQVANTWPRQQFLDWATRKRRSGRPGAMS